MAGNTGKMTTEALAARGPRMRLVKVRSNTRSLGFIICREGEKPPFHANAVLKVPYLLSGTYATSYSLSYLFRVAKVNS